MPQANLAERRSVRVGPGRRTERPSCTGLGFGLGLGFGALLGLDLGLGVG